jgi:hypothetical protein
LVRDLTKLARDRRTGVILASQNEINQSFTSLLLRPAIDDGDIFVREIGLPLRERRPAGLLGRDVLVHIHRLDPIVI